MTIEKDSLDLSEWDDVIGAEQGDVLPEKVKESTIDKETNDDDWGDAVAIEILEDYCSSLMLQMEVFRQEKTLCDAVIIVDDRELTVHKNVLSAVSPFFKNIFSQLTNPEDSRITLRNISGNVMNDILHFTYTGEVFVHDGNVRQLVATANFLQFQSLKDMSVAYLEQKLSPASAAEILILADKHNCKTLTSSAEKLISDNFIIVSKTEGFKKLPLEILYQFIKSEDIRVVKEEEVFEAVMFWVESDSLKNEREIHLADLLHEIRFPLISPSFISEALEKSSILKRNSVCYDMVLEGKKFHSCNTKVLTDPKLMQPRKFMGVVSGIVCVGGWESEKSSKEVYAFIPSTFKWYPLAPLMEARYLHSISTCEGFIYVIGGRDDTTKLLASVMRFNPSDNTWHKVKSLPFRAASIGVCEFKGHIYTVGGFSSIGSIDVVLRYSSRYDNWQRMPNLKCARGAASVLANENFMFAIGGINKYGSGIDLKWEYLNTMEVYKLEYKSWSFSAQIPTPRAYASSVCLNDKIYLYGGQSELLGYKKDIEIFDIKLMVWSSVIYSGIPRLMNGISVVGEKIYVVGGFTKDRECMNSVESFDIINNKWSTVSLLPVRTGAVECCTMELRLAVLKGMIT